ncbi:MAG TPA: glycosyltransferase family 4 protein [Pyrinomonadaceae bacterium]|nr:glycosyltransferase family 4 protein [Pyrinomonadaceae bacterium]
MKILLAESYSYFALGGASKVDRELIQGLAQKGHSCAAVSIEDPQEITARGFKPGRTKGVFVLEVDGLKIFASENVQDQWRPMLECFQTFDPDWTIVCEHGILLLATALEEREPLRVVPLVQSTITHLPTESSGIIEEHVRSLLRRTGGIITVSNYMRDYIKRWSGLDSTVLYLPSYGPGPFTRFHNFDSGYVTMVNPCAYKGISIFLPLARSLPEVKFGAVPFWGTTPQDRAALLELPNVTFLEPVVNLDDLFKQTKVLLVPSLWGEAFPQVVGDAMLRGIPVMASNAGGLPETKLGVDYVIPVNMIERYVLDSENQVQPVVPEQDITPWTETLRSLLADRALYERVAFDSREAALSYVNSLGPHHVEQYLEGLAADRKEAQKAHAP